MKTEQPCNVNDVTRGDLADGSEVYAQRVVAALMKLQCIEDCTQARLRSIKCLCACRTGFESNRNQSQLCIYS